MKYKVNELKAILNKIETYSDTVDLMEYSRGEGLKFEYKDKALGFPVDTAIELRPIDEDSE